MKVGVISKGSPDYLIDIVTDGLIRLLGRQSVALDYNVRGGCSGSYAHLLQGFQGPETLQHQRCGSSDRIDQERRSDEGVGEEERED